MNLILKHDPVWLGSLPVTTPDGSATLVLIGGDGQQVAVPTPVLLAVSPLVRSMLSDLLPPPYCPCFLSLPATGKVLQVVRDILTTGKVAGDHVDEIEEVRQVLGMLGVEAVIVSHQLESIQVGQVFERYIKEELSTEGPHNSLEEEKVKVEVIVKIEDRKNNDVEADTESNTLGQSLKPKNYTPKLSLRLKSPYNYVPNKTFMSCTLCSEKFASRSLLSRHIEFVHKTGMLCNFCPQKFTLKQTLNQHIKTKHVKGEITCNICSKKFTRKGSLVKHVKAIHEQIRMQCNLCPQNFSWKESLERHIKSVHKQIKIQCSQCLKRFTNEGHLVRHIKAVHDQIRMQCNPCPQKFARKESLEMHIKSVHEQIKIQCKHCPQKFSEKSSLVQHIQSAHKQN